jgi:hypothetical protein
MAANPALLFFPLRREIAYLNITIFMRLWKKETGPARINERAENPTTDYTDKDRQKTGVSKQLY